MRRRTCILILALCLLPGCSRSPGHAPQNGSSSLAASHGLETLRKLVNAANYRSMGFESLDEVRSASLGDPLHLYLVRLDQLRGFQPGGNPETLLTDIGQDLYPVLVAGSVRSAVLVEKQGEQWSAVGFGGANLAKALGQRRSANSAVSEAAAPSYFEVHVAALSMYFLGYRQENRLMLVPLVDDPKYKFSAGTPVPADNVFAVLAPAAKALQTDKPL
jgi:hypothetical protein